MLLKKEDFQYRNYLYKHLNAIQKKLAKGDGVMERMMLPLSFPENKNTMPQEEEKYFPGSHYLTPLGPENVQIISLKLYFKLEKARFLGDLDIVVKEPAHISESNHSH